MVEALIICAVGLLHVLKFTWPIAIIAFVLFWRME